MATFFVVTSRVWREKGTAKSHKELDFHWVVTWEKLAEIVGKYLKRGDLVYVDGRLQTRKWQDGDREWRCLSEVVASNMIMLGGNKKRRREVEETGDAVGIEETDEATNGEG